MIRQHCEDLIMPLMLQDVIFAITDTETTGRKQGYDRAIEIASVKWNLQQGFLDMPETWMVNPQMRIHPSAMAVHHLTEKDLIGAKTLDELEHEVKAYVKNKPHEIMQVFEGKTSIKNTTNDSMVNHKTISMDDAENIKNENSESYEKYQAFIDEVDKTDYITKLNPMDCAILIAHNAAFDQSMLPFFSPDKYLWIDSLRLARHIWSIGDLNEFEDDLTSHTCQELRYWLGLEVDTMGLAAHRAAADILVAGEVFNVAVKKYLEYGNSPLFKDFYEFSTAPIFIEKMAFGKHKDKYLEDIEIDYFKWMLNESFKGKMNLGEDLEYSIKKVLKARGIDAADLIDTGKANSWADVATQRRTFSLSRNKK